MRWPTRSTWQIGTLATKDVARAAWDANGAIIVTGTLDEAIPLVNRARARASRARLRADVAEALFAGVRHAGSVFLGRHTPEAVGDYVAGPNHVLPTGRRARFSSGLSVLDFMKRTSFLALRRPRRSPRSARPRWRWPRPRGCPRTHGRWRSALTPDAV